MRAPHVQAIRARNFMSHKLLELDLPKKGCVLITGPNGSGKSSIIEAVAWALWGKTIRGTPPFPNEGSTQAQIEFVDGSSFARLAKGKKPKKLTAIIGGHEVEAGTTTKAQAIIDGNVLPYDLWRRSFVLSGQDLSSFTRAPDAERKRVIEAVLGLDRLDEAYRKARRNKGSADAAQSAAAMQHARAAGQVEALGKLDYDLPLDAPPADAEAELEKTVRAARKALSASQIRMRRHTEELNALKLRESRLQAEERQLRDRFSLLDKGRCDACGQLIGEGTLISAKDSLEKASHLLDQTVRKQLARKDRLQSLVEEEAAIAGWLDKKARNKEKELWELKRAKEADSKRHQLLAKIRAAEASLGDAAHNLNCAEQDLLAHKAACEVLSPKGVRSQLLKRALKEASAIANDWLQEFSDSDLSLEILPHTEKKDGTSTGSISINIEGAGGDYGYKACSGGQRRRIDVAILLALASVAGAAYGLTGGTLWLDEVFNELDKAGSAAFAGMIEDLARDRCVVVITHRQAIVREALPVTRHYQINSEGEVERLK